MTFGDLFSICVIIFVFLLISGKAQITFSIKDEGLCKTAVINNNGFIIEKGCKK